MAMTHDRTTVLFRVSSSDGPMTFSVHMLCYRLTCKECIMYFVFLYKTTHFVLCLVEIARDRDKSACCVSRVFEYFYCIQVCPHVLFSIEQSCIYLIVICYIIVDIVIPVNFQRFDLCHVIKHEFLLCEKHSKMN
jgi:hypothetical protein